MRAELASAFALVFHELATNSAKYGALAVPEGRIRIALHKDTEGATVEWHEQGCVIAERNGQGRGFGSKLLTAVVEGQFRGTFERNLGPEGMRVTLRLPPELFQEKDYDPV